jgi:hypothetical protein
VTLRFTERQEQVIDGIRRGQEYRAIAAEMRLSVRTVQGHVQEIMNKLPNDGLSPYLCIFLFARHREWVVSSIEDAVKRDEAEDPRSSTPP